MMLGKLIRNILPNTLAVLGARFLLNESDTDHLGEVGGGWECRAPMVIGDIVIGSTLPVSIEKSRIHEKTTGSLRKLYQRRPQTLTLKPLIPTWAASTITINSNTSRRLERDQCK